MNPAPMILLVVTSHSTLSDGKTPTGFWLEELAVPYYTFVDAGARVVIASPQGGKAPMDPKSVNDKLDPASARFLSDDKARQLLDHSVKIADVEAASVDAIFLVGGHGTMFDLPSSKPLQSAIEKIWGQGGVVAAVCHGPAGLVSARDASGKSIVSGKKVTGFSNDEEGAAGMTKVMPFLLEDRLKSLGGNYSHGAKWQAFAIRDGRLVTGQNPASSKKTADEVLAALPR